MFNQIHSTPLLYLFLYINDNSFHEDMEGANYNWGITLLVQKSAGHYYTIIDLTNKSLECL